MDGVITFQSMPFDRKWKIVESKQKKNLSIEFYRGNGHCDHQPYTHCNAIIKILMLMEIETIYFWL